MKTLSIDSSVFISAFLPDDVHHCSSKAFLEHIEGTNCSVQISVLVIMEVLQVFYRLTHSEERTQTVFDHFVDWGIQGGLHILPIEAEFLVYFSMHHTKLHSKTADSIIAVSARQKDCTLISWDKSLLKQSSKLVKSMNPDEFLAQTSLLC